MTDRDRHIEVIQHALDNAIQSINGTLAIMERRGYTQQQKSAIVARIEHLDAARAWLDTLQPVAGADGLLPCPFCGATEPIVETTHTQAAGWFPYCNRCECTVDIAFATKEEAIEWWNRRAQPSAMAEWEAVPDGVYGDIEIAEGKIYVRDIDDKGGVLYGVRPSYWSPRHQTECKLPDV